MGAILTIFGLATSDRGGWAWVRRGAGGATASEAGGEVGASSWRMELKALVEGLRSTAPGAQVGIYVNNPSLVQLCDDWIERWRAKGWKKKGGISDLDLVKPLAGLLDDRRIHVLRASGDEQDLREAKRLARRALQQATATASSEPQRVPGSDQRIVAYTDGGSRGNPGPGGWGFLLLDTRTGRALAQRGGEADTTNNRMEITAALRALEALKGGRRSVEIRTDSTYLRNIATRWLDGWKQRGWRKADGEPIANRDLVERLDELLGQHDVHWSWVAGHSGEPGNEYADDLTNQAMDALQAGRDPAATERFRGLPIAVG